MIRSGNLSNDPLSRLDRDYVFMSMRLVRVMARSGSISWSERREIADAMLSLEITHRSMRREQEYLMQDGSGGAAQQASSPCRTDADQ